VLQEYGYEMQYFRPPCGEYSEESLAVTQSLGYQTILWSFAYVDWNVDSQPDPSTALNKVVSSAHSGGIYLLHSVSQTNADILGDVIDQLRAEGYTL
jgi:peptidoglycan-N-acetylmuramic acid deacetylase